MQKGFFLFLSSPQPHTERRPKLLQTPPANGFLGILGAPALHKHGFVLRTMGFHCFPPKPGSHPGLGCGPTAPSHTALCTAPRSAAPPPLLSTLQGGNLGFQAAACTRFPALRFCLHPPLPVFPPSQCRTIQQAAVNRVELGRELCIYGENKRRKLKANLQPFPNLMGSILGWICWEKQPWEQQFPYRGRAGPLRGCARPWRGSACSAAAFARALPAPQTLGRGAQFAFAPHPAFHAL